MKTCNFKLHIVKWWFIMSLIEACRIIYLLNSLIIILDTRSESILGVRLRILRFSYRCTHILIMLHLILLIHFFYSLMHSLNWLLTMIFNKIGCFFHMRVLAHVRSCVLRVILRDRSNWHWHVISKVRWWRYIICILLDHLRGLISVNHVVWF